MGERGHVVRLDHVPVAVRDLAEASAVYRAIGFSIKPGRHHSNGIRNAHAKFGDGSSIELITAGAAVDTLTARYLEFLDSGDGPAFLALQAGSFDELVDALRSGGYAFRRAGDVVELRQPGLEYLFFVKGSRSPTDRPEHLSHRSGAAGLRAVWLATDAGAELERLLVHLGGSSTRRDVWAPDSMTVPVVTLDQGEVVILPASHQVVAGRAVIGMSVRVSDVDAVREQLSAAGIEAPVETGGPRRVLVPPRAAHGAWLEFR
jgi:hypothetical protein